MKLSREELNCLASWADEANHIKLEQPASDDFYFKQRNIRRQGNQIYFYDYIDEETQMIFTNLIKEATRDILTEHVGDIIEGRLNEFITVHLNSPGGRADCGLALFDFIKTSKIPINCVIEGSADSAATLIFLASHHREMTLHSTFMIHQCSWGGYGQNRKMQDMALNAEKLMAKLRRIYFTETTFGATNSKGEKLSDEDRILYIQQQLEHDIEWSYDECKRYGVIDIPFEEYQLSPENQIKVEEFAEKLLKAQQAQKEKDSKSKEKKSIFKKETKEKPVKEKQKKEKTVKEKTPKEKTESKGEEPTK